MTKRGRPKVRAADRRRETLFTAVTAEEKARAVARATECHMSTSAWLRHLILLHTDLPEQPGEKHAQS